MPRCAPVPRVRPRALASALPAGPPVTVSPSPAPIATSSTIFQLGFERALRKQNKEQVPPAAAPEPPQRKQHSGKSGKKAPGSDAGAAPGRCRSLEEALKAVSVPGPGSRERSRALPRSSLTCGLISPRQELP